MIKCMAFRPTKPTQGFTQKDADAIKQLIDRMVGTQNVRFCLRWDAADERGPIKFTAEFEEFKL